MIGRQKIIETLLQIKNYFKQTPIESFLYLKIKAMLDERVVVVKRLLRNLLLTELFCYYILWVKLKLKLHFLCFS